MRKITQKNILVMLVLASFIIAPLYGEKKITGENPGPYFSISLLCPNTSPARNQWASLMVEQLPKIGIAVDIFDHTGWAQISPRVWGHPGPYPIPTYAEGGYDILFVGWSGGLDWDPTGLYDSPSITPNGDNFYQYNNPVMDNAIGNYTSSFVLADRIEWLEEIQAILYEDNPSIPIIYPLEVYPHNENVTNFSGLLWSEEYHPFYKMFIPGETEFHYATPAHFEDFHPYIFESVYDAQWLRQIYNGLLQRDSSINNGYSPWLCESFSSSDGLTYNVVIKTDACWADGTDLTTDDIIYNYQLAVTQSLAGTSYSSNIKYWDNSSITKTNDKEFSITFKQAYVFQDGNLALDLIPEHIWGAIAPADHEAASINWTNNHPEKMFGAGPYMLDDYNATNGVIQLEANPHFTDWHGAAPSFDDIYFEYKSSKEAALAALAAGTIDMVDAQFSPQLNELNLPGVSYTLVDDPGVQEMVINMEHPYLGTGDLCPNAGKQSARYIRKAISHILPREMICNEILNGLGRPGVTACPSVAIGFDDSLDYYEYSIETALQYMALAGFDAPVPTPTPTPTPTTSTNSSFNIGIAVPVIIGIFALIGSSILIVNKRRK